MEFTAVAKWTLSLAKGRPISAHCEIEVEVVGMVGIAAGPEYGSEWPARGPPHL